MTTPVQEIPLQYRFRPDNLHDIELQVIVGSLNRYGVNNPLAATAENLTAFTWDQVLQALQLSRRDCKGDSLDDVDDVIFAVRDERKSFLH
jgi:hypothetical protein